MPRSKEENERIRHLAKQNIRTAAMEMFIERGYHAASIDDIAKRANISKGLLYNYYKGKEDLLSEMVMLYIQDIAKVMEDALLSDTPALQLKYIVEHSLDHVAQYTDVYRFFLNLQTQPKEDKVLAKYSQMLNEEMSSQFEAQCEIFLNMRAKEPRMRSLYFSSTLHGTMQMISAYPNRFPVQEIKNQIIAQFCRGVIE